MDDLDDDPTMQNLMEEESAEAEPEVEMTPYGTVGGAKLQRHYLLFTTSF